MPLRLLVICPLLKAITIPKSCGKPRSRRIRALSHHGEPVEMRIWDCGFRIVLFKKALINSKSAIANPQSKGPPCLRGETGRLVAAGSLSKSQLRLHQI